MNFFSQTRYGLEGVYDIYIKNIRNIYSDNMPGIQLVYVVDKEIKYYIDGKEIIAKKGDILFINQCENRFLYSEDKDNLCLILNIYADFIKILGEDYCKYRFVNHIDSLSVEKNIVKNLIYIYTNTIKHENFDIIDNYLRSIIDLFIDNYINIEKSTGNLVEKKKYLIEVEDLIINKKIENLNLKYLSNTLNLSSSYISKLFYELTGIKFTDYIQQLKLSSATTYLLKTKYSIEKIAILVGFESTKSINRIFRRYLNISPSKYREIYAYETNNINQKEKFEKYIKRIEIEEYSEFINAYARNRELEHTIDLQKASKDKNIKKIFKDWQIIRNLNSLGTDYLKGFKNIIKNSEIKEIILKFYYDKDLDDFVLTDLGKSVNITDIYSILSICIEQEIRGSIEIDLGEIDEDEDIDIQIEHKIYEFERFYNLISNVIGTTNMKKFRYSLVVKDLIKFKDDKYNIMKYRKYIARKQLYLERKLGVSDFDFGFNLGTIGIEEIKELNKTYYNLMNKESGYKFKPSFLVINYDNDNVFRGVNPKAIDDMLEYIDKTLSQLDELKLDLKNIANEIYIKDLLTFLDISDVDINYRELFMVLIMIERTFSFNDINYITEYKVRDLRESDGYYLARTIDDLGFFTPIYFGIHLMNQIKGKVIYNEGGCIVTLHENDYYVIIYGDLKVDYLFAAKKNFKNLNKYMTEIKLDFKNINGMYKIVTEVLSYEHGTVKYNLKDFENDKFLTNFEKDYIKRITVPKIDIKIREINNNYTEKINYSPFSIILKKFIKI